MPPTTWTSGRTSPCWTSDGSDIRSSAACSIDLRTGAWRGSVQASGPSLSHRLPALVVWLSFGLRGPDVANGSGEAQEGFA